MIIKHILAVVLLCGVANAECPVMPNKSNWRLPPLRAVFKTPMEHRPTIGVVALPTNTTFRVEILDSNKKLIKRLNKWASGEVGDIYHSSFLGSDLKKKYNSIYVRIRRGKKGEKCALMFVKDPAKRSDAAPNV